MNKVLENLNIVLTRAKSQSVDTIRLLEQLGANVISFPTISIKTIFGNDELNRIINNINHYNSLIFTSENAVKSLLELIDNLSVNFNPKAFFIISIGDKTTEFCRANNFRVDFQSKSATSQDLLRELSHLDLVGRKFLIPSSSLSNPNQFDSLQDLGAEVNQANVYTNEVNKIENLSDKINLVKSINIDVFIFTSPSTFNGFLKILDISNPQKYFDEKITAVIGPVTEKALINVGIRPNIMPKKYSMKYLIEEITNYYSTENINS